MIEKHPFLRPDAQISRVLPSMTATASSSSRNTTMTTSQSGSSAFKINDFTLNSPFEMLANEFKAKMRELAEKVEVSQRKEGMSTFNEVV